MKTLLLSLIINFTFMFPNSFAEEVDQIKPSAPYNFVFVNKELDKFVMTFIGSGDDGREGQAKGYTIKYSKNEILNEADWEEALALEVKFEQRPDEKLIRVNINLTDDQYAGYLAVRAYDEASNLSDITENSFYKIFNPFEFLGDKITKDPKLAMSVGNENNRTKSLFGCVAKADKYLIPGKYSKWFRGCNFVSGSREKNTRTFRYYRKDLDAEWVAHTTEGIPERGVVLGKIAERELFACRGELYGGVHAGYVEKASKACIVPYGGSMKRLTKWEVLVKK